MPSAQPGPLCLGCPSPRLTSRAIDWQVLEATLTPSAAAVPEMSCANQGRYMTSQTRARKRDCRPSLGASSASWAPGSQWGNPAWKAEPEKHWRELSHTQPVRNLQQLEGSPPLSPPVALLVEEGSSCRLVLPSRGEEHPVHTPGVAGAPCDACQL